MEVEVCSWAGIVAVGVDVVVGGFEICFAEAAATKVEVPEQVPVIAVDDNDDDIDLVVARTVFDC